RLGEKEIFGEMSLIEERPRCATVKAIEETLLQEIPRADFSKSLQSDPDTALSLIKVLFERLREANSTIMQLQKDVPLSCHLPDVGILQRENGLSTTIFLEGLTPTAVKTLPTNPFEIKKFPFRIGRQSHDPLVTNDLMIPDSNPHQIAIHHLAFIQTKEGLGVVDRGSQFGSLLNGDQLGGVDGDPKPVMLTEPESILVLGHVTSPFKFKICLKTKE
ncbi:MAG: cyclic nucleotide-binding domain-containing protein, partial [Nitrospirales bacterium]|nr:cyclic nucleotide-binding domain-containing protein [Nitrospirales bacterium]